MDNKNDAKNVNVGKGKLWLQEKKRKVKEFVGKHMWIRDTCMIGVGVGLGKVAEIAFAVGKEMINQTTKPEAPFDDTPTTE